LLFPSAINKRVPSLAMPVGTYKVWEEGAPPWLTRVAAMLVWPISTSAGALKVAGILLKIKTRLFPESATNSWFPNL